MSNAYTKRLHIEPTWLFRDDSGNTLDPQLFRLLQAVHQHKKLTKAAAAAGVSYRHGWNLLNKWAAFFGTNLVELHQGRGATLTPLGEKLLWAEQRVVARFQPQMESLASELNVEIQKALANTAPQLRIQASHGYAVALLPNVCKHLQLDLQYRTSQEAWASLNRGNCDLAGLHIPRGIALPATQKRYRSMARPRSQRMVRFITRQQGLIVAAGNPHGVTRLEDIARPELRLINRQAESGTRALLDQLLNQAQITTELINGYDNQEFTHSAVAAHVASGMADVGFGVCHAAHLFGLEFVPLCEEDYVFVCHKQSLNKAATDQFLAAIKSTEFIDAVGQLAGYRADSSGEVETLDEWITEG